MPKVLSSVQACYLNGSKEHRLEWETVPGLALPFYKKYNYYIVPKAKFSESSQHAGKLHVIAVTHMNSEQL